MNDLAAIGTLAPWLQHHRDLEATTLAALAAMLTPFERSGRISGFSRARIAIARHPNASVKLLEQIATGTDPEAARVAVLHLTDPAALQRLVQTVHPDALADLCRHPDLPAQAVQTLLAHLEPQIRQLAALHRHAPVSATLSLLGSLNPRDLFPGQRFLSDAAIGLVLQDKRCLLGPWATGAVSRQDWALLAVVAAAEGCPQDEQALGTVLANLDRPGVTAALHANPFRSPTDAPRQIGGVSPQRLVELVCSEVPVEQQTAVNTGSVTAQRSVVARHGLTLETGQRLGSERDRIAAPVDGRVAALLCLDEA